MSYSFIKTQIIIERFYKIIITKINLKLINGILEK